MKLKLRTTRDIVFIKAGPKGGPLQWIHKNDLRQVADALHDLADDIDREKGRTP